MFNATLFTKAKLWKQPKRPSMDEWIKNMCEKKKKRVREIYIYTHTMEYYSAITKQ